MCWRIAKTDAQLLAALLYRDAACYIEQHQSEYMYWQQSRASNDTTDTGKQEKGGTVNEADWIPKV